MPAPSPMPATSANTNSSANTARRHDEYYIDGADLIIHVENTLFRIHRYFLTRDSAYFRDRLPHPPSPGDLTKGPSDNNPLVLDNVLKVEFERLLWVFYNPKYSPYIATIEEWTSILKLAHQWDFIEVKALAVRELQNLSVPPLQKIVTYQKYAIDRNLLQPAFTALTMRDEPITIDEGRELSLETALQLAKAREIARAPVFSGKKSGNPRSPITLAGVELDALIKDVFTLPPSTGPPSTPEASTGRGTPIGGRDTPQPNTHTNSTGSSNPHQATEGLINGFANGHTNGTSHGSIFNGSPRSIFNSRAAQK